MNEMQVFNEGGFATPVVCVIIADSKAQVALSGCCNFKCNDPLAHVCWLCGANRLHCLGALGQGISILPKVWQWGGMTLPPVLPFQRPSNFGLHGVRPFLHCAGSWLVKAVMPPEGWTNQRVVQWFWDDIKVFCTERRLLWLARPGMTLRLRAVRPRQLIVSKRRWESWPCDWSKMPRGHG